MQNSRCYFYVGSRLTNICICISIFMKFQRVLQRTFRGKIIPQFLLYCEIFTFIETHLSNLFKHLQMKTCDRITRT